ncbi:MAG: CotH kinase family protein [Acholeplasmatales bacterium]|nr:CotH kinase family protein [Acholeplasmatales bacterium]
MKKIIGGLLCISLSFSLLSCKKKKSTDKTTTKANTTNISTTTQRQTTSKHTTTIDIPRDNIDYESNYSPIISDKLPRIDIVVNDSTIPEEEKMDFVTKPGLNDEPDYTKCLVTVINESDVVELDAKGAGVKVRGNYTKEYDKKPLRIKFDKKQAMLGLNDDPDNPDDGKYKNWLLLAEYKDWSLERNSTAFYLAHLMSDYYVTDFRLVEVYINGNYWGVYLLAEQQEVKEGRVDISEYADDYEGTDIGYFLEFDGYAYQEPALQQFYVDYKPLYDYTKTQLFSNFQRGFTIKNDLYSTAQRDFIHSYIQNVFDICYYAIYEEKYYSFNSTYTSISLDSSLKNSYEAISKVIDVDSLVNSFLLADITCDTDTAWSSFLMDVDFSENGNKKLTFEAPWDYDSALGNTKACVSGEGEFAASIFINAINEETGNPWYMLFYQCDWFMNLVRDKFNSMKEKGYFTRVLNYINTLSTKYETSFNNNYTKWDNIGHPEKTGWEQNENSRKCTTQKQAAEQLHSWLTTRINSLDKVYNKKS